MEIKILNSNSDSVSQSNKPIVKEMGSQGIDEVRLKSFLGQLQAERGILDRIVYKNKNQHRRCSYFQYLLKVRSDLRLLQAAQLDEILSSSLLVINGKRAKQKVQLLESLKRRKGDGGKHNFSERLLGAARLLSQMVEPMLKAATEISTLLARSFFMGFSLTILALLARLRVLVQQILLDVVSVFNMVSSLSQKEQSVKLTQKGFEVFREYYPTKERAVSLECVWETDKFVLLERINEPESKCQDLDVGEVVSLGASAIQYQSIETLLGVDEGEVVSPGASAIQSQSIETLLGDEGSGKVDPNINSEESPANINDHSTSPLEGPVTENDDDKRVEDDTKVEDGSGVPGPPSKNLPAEGDMLTSCSPHSDPLKLKSGVRNKVAFISVKRPVPSTANEIGFRTMETQSNNGEREDPFFSLLTGGKPEGSSLLDIDN